MLNLYSLKNKIFIWYSILFLLILIIVLIPLNIYIYDSLNEQSISKLDVLTDKTCRQLNEKLEQMNTISLQICFSKNISNIFGKTQAYYGDQNYFDSFLSDASLLEDDFYFILGLDVTNTVINLFNKNAFISTSPIRENWDILKQSRINGIIAEINGSLQNNPSKPVLIGPQSVYWSQDQETQIKYFSLSRKFMQRSTGKNIGVIQVLKPMSNLEELCFSSDEKTHIVIFDKQFHIVGRSCLDSELENDIGDMLNWYATRDLKSSVQVSKSGKSYLLSLKYLDKYGYGILTMQTYDVVYTTFRITKIIILSMALLLWLLSMQLSFMVSRSLTKPLNQITNSLHNITWNNFEMDLQLDSSNNELQILKQSYDAMIVRIRQSMNQVLESRLNEQKAYYMALQSQISPHFLYNIIGNISALAYENGVWQIVNMCNQMSNMLRYATDYSSNNSTLEQELDYTKNYLSLMKIRYEDQFSFFINMDERCNSVPVPRIMLNTLVENCFKHAFPNAPSPWVITINTYIDDKNYWIVEIIDNGVGIDENHIKDIIEQSIILYQNALDNVTQLQLGGLGILNSITRLRLLYNNQIYFSAQPMYRGTIIKFGGDCNAKQI